MGCWPIHESPNKTNQIFKYTHLNFVLYHVWSYRHCAIYIMWSLHLTFMTLVIIILFIVNLKMRLENICSLPKIRAGKWRDPSISELMLLTMAPPCLLRWGPGSGQQVRTLSGNSRIDLSRAVIPTSRNKDLIFIE